MCVDLSLPLYTSETVNSCDQSPVITMFHFFSPSRNYRFWVHFESYSVTKRKRERQRESRQEGIWLHVTFGSFFLSLSSHPPHLMTTIRWYFYTFWTTRDEEIYWSFQERKKVGRERSLPVPLILFCWLPPSESSSSWGLWSWLSWWWWLNSWNVNHHHREVC